MTVLPVNSESEMNPPLEKFGFEQKSKSVVRPSMCTRRTGDACEVAQNSRGQAARLAGGVDGQRFESERQKLTSAVQSFGPKHWLNESTVPSTFTSSGDAPRPATSV